MNTIKFIILVSMVQLASNLTTNTVYGQNNSIADEFMERLEENLKIIVPKETI